MTATPAPSSRPRTVAIVTLGCGRNEVDSEQAAGALEAAGFRLSDDPDTADCVLVNTCTFIEPARKESVEAILEACEGSGQVVVMGCMAQRYGAELAEAVPEAAAVIGFSDYPRLADVVREALGEPHPRALLPILQAAPGPAAPPTASWPVRTQPKGPWAYLKIAGGCDRACTFCTIPSYRGSFESRPLEEVVAEARWLVEGGVRELICVSENTTSWGKDLPSGRRGQVDLLRAFEKVEGLERVRLLYLQPDEVRAELLEEMAASRVVAGYYDLSLQHASPSVLTRMGRAGGAERFADLICGIRQRDPTAVFRSSFIVGFPGETEADVRLLEEFLLEARIDWAGFFCYSPEDGTPSALMGDQVDPDEARARRDHLTAVAEGVAESQAESFIGRQVPVLIEGTEDGAAIGRSYREAPETDGEVRLPGCDLPIGGMVPVELLATDGVDLIGRVALGRSGG